MTRYAAIILVNRLLLDITCNYLAVKCDAFTFMMGTIAPNQTFNLRLIQTPAAPPAIYLLETSNHYNLLSHRNHSSIYPNYYNPISLNACTHKTTTIIITVSKNRHLIHLFVCVTIYCATYEITDMNNHQLVLRHFCFDATK